VLSLKALVTLVLASGVATSCSPREWPSLWTSYTATFMDGQIRVIDRDSNDRTTSEGQAYGMFFALVANDRPRFDKLLRWTEVNLAEGDLSARLPAWLWGRGADDRWDVLDANSASDADVWLAYALFEAGDAWRDPRYTRLAEALATRIADEEVVHVPPLGPVLLPGAHGFVRDGTYRLNASYLPLQLFIALGERQPRGPWTAIADTIPRIVRASAPGGFATDWIEVGPGGAFTPSSHGSYDAIRTYLWAGVLDPDTPSRDALLQTLGGMVNVVRASRKPPARVRANGTVHDGNGPIGFAAALVPYLEAVGETRLAREQLSRVRDARDAQTGLLGRPAKYYDQNLALFALGATERLYWFDARGRLRTNWMGSIDGDERRTQQISAR
jgi:endoglucanase